MLSFALAKAGAAAYPAAQDSLPFAKARFFWPGFYPMHWFRLILFLLVPLLLALAGPLLILWAWGAGKSLLPALLVGIIFLATALVIFLVGQMAAPNEQEEDIALLWHELESLRKQVAELRAGKAPEPMETTTQREAPPAGTLAGNAPAPRAQSRAPSSKSEEAQRPSAATGATAGQSASAAAAMSPSKPRVLVPAAGDAYRLYMEPVMRLRDNALRVYRAHAALPGKGEQVYLGRQAQLLARQRGEAAALQLHTLRRCIDFAEQLRARGAALPVVCSLDVVLMDMADVVRQCNEMLRAFHAAHGAGGILLALAMADLEKSGREERRNVLLLAQNVSGFVLDFSVLPVADAPLPLPLPVRYLDIPAAALALGGALSDWASQRQRFHQRGMRLVASGVDTDAALERARKMADLGRGARFSPPRRVREELLAGNGAPRATGGVGAAAGQAAPRERGGERGLIHAAR